MPKITYRQNGTGHAFLREVGCPCPQCHAPVRKAQTSGSLLISDNAGKLCYHLLFDCGLGVVDSLLSADIGTVTHVFISHNHPDHCLELDRLLQGVLRSARRANRDVRIPCYCTAGTRRNGPDYLFPYLQWDRVDVLPNLPFRPYAYAGNGSYEHEGLKIGLKVTPIPVYHGNPSIVPAPVIWVLEFDSQDSSGKIVLGWDFLHLVPRYEEEETDGGYNGPVADVLHPSHQVLQHADLLVLEGNTWEPHPETGHTSIKTGLSVSAPLLQPKGPVWFVHYSGHEDPGGAISDWDLQVNINMEAQAVGLGVPATLAQSGKTMEFPG